MRSIVLGVLFATGLALPAGAQSKGLDDATIVAIFDLANTADIETGQLAARLGHSAQVRELGRNFATAHTQVRQQGRDLAKKLGVTPTPPADGAMAKQHAEAMAKLRTLKGAEFDRAFLAHEIAFHSAVIEAVTTTLLPAATNPELRALIEQVAPAFIAHLEVAKSLEKKLTSTTAGH